MPEDYEALARALMGGKSKLQSSDKLEGLIRSEEGQRIAESLSGSSSAEIKAAAQAVLRGDEAGARAALAKVLSTPEGAELFRKLAKMNGR